uniref:Uncharacterized protein n=1 Tax=Davidia involucrata TaxID=16924 RepID=A0A5B7BCT5_DAVIN
MNLNCLKCQKELEKELGERYDHGMPHFRLCCAKVERSWSGNLAPRPYGKMREMQSALLPEKRVKKGHSRIHSSGPVEYESSAPRLVRSCGMRRDWSFENLMQTRDVRG